jgi:hypothetical protein
VRLLRDAESQQLAVFVGSVALFEWAEDDQATRRLVVAQVVNAKQATRVEVARVFGLHVNTVSRIAQQVATEGVAASVRHKRGPRGPWRKLAMSRATAVWPMYSIGPTQASGCAWRGGRPSAPPDQEGQQRRLGCAARSCRPDRSTFARLGVEGEFTHFPVVDAVEADPDPSGDDLVDSIGDNLVEGGLVDGLAAIAGQEQVQQRRGACQAARVGFKSRLEAECEWLVANDVLPIDVVRRNHRLAEAALRPWTPVFTHGDPQITHVFIDGDEVTGIIDWSEASQGDALFDLATLTLAHEEHLEDVLAGYGTDVDRDLIRAWWSWRCLVVVRWLFENGFGPIDEYPENRRTDITAVRLYESGAHRTTADFGGRVRLPALDSAADYKRVPQATASLRVASNRTSQTQMRSPLALGPLRTCRGAPRPQNDQGLRTWGRFQAVEAQPHALTAQPALPGLLEAPRPDSKEILQ